MTAPEESNATGLSPSKLLRHRILPLVAEVIVMALSLLPRPVALGLGSCFGTLWWLIDFSSRRMVLSNLAASLPELSSRERHRICRGVFRHFAKMAFDTQVLQRWGQAKVMERIRIKNWDEAVAKTGRIWKRSQGAIWLVPHIGNWEVLASKTCWEVEDAACIGKRYRVEGYQRIVARMRTRLGTRIYYQEHALRNMVAMLRRNGLIGILPDLDARRMPGVFVPFFGRDAYTTDSPARLALKTGACLMTVGCVYDRGDYLFDVGAIIDPDDYRDEPDPVEAMTECWLGEVEKVIRRHPHQWAWLHDRWHSTPESVARRRERERLRDLAAREKLKQESLSTG